MGEVVEMWEMRYRDFERDGRGGKVGRWESCKRNDMPWNTWMLRIAYVLVNLLFISSSLL